MNYYEETIVQIKTLIKQHQLPEALQKLNIELSMPYIPDDTHQILVNLKKDVVEALKNKKPNSSTLNADIVLQMLGADDQEQQQNALDFLPHINLRAHIEPIKQILLSKVVKNPIKTLILHNLKLQELKGCVQVNINNQIYDIDLQTLDFENDFSFIQQIDQLISQSIENENPVLANLAKLLNMQHYLNNFMCFDKRYLHERAVACIISVGKMMQQDIPSKSLKTWFNYNEEVANTIALELQNEQNSVW